ncbi:hypothetical protein QBC43DRAFT_325300 [Cladorrhinum sp. PSN259]|nr:hypothetical protein QBC43DRAFT_325300 [Cladorrhinum sp. PSN259]
MQKLEPTAVDPNPSPLTRLATPFPADQSTSSVDACLANLPPSLILRGITFRPKRDINCYLASELQTWKLDKISKHFWYAGLKNMPARPLHRHRLSRREIVITESPSEHLLSDYSVVFVKPLPRYLLCHEFWEAYLSTQVALHAAACGMLLSYTWLVAYPSDFEIAKECRLLPDDMIWTRWTSLVAAFLDSLEAGRAVVSGRYTYGEMRLSRVNDIYKFLPSLWERDNPARGYMPTSIWNKSFIQRNPARLLTIFAVFSLVLTSMQVGLATDRLQADPAFLKATYGLTITVLVLVLLFGLAILVWVIWHFRYNIMKPWSLHISQGKDPAR